MDRIVIVKLILTVFLICFFAITYESWLEMFFGSEEYRRWKNKRKIKALLKKWGIE